LLGLVNHVSLAIVVLPVVVNNPSGGVQFSVSWRARIRHHQTDSGIIQTNVAQHIDRASEYLFIVCVKAKYDASLKSNRIRVSLCYETSIILDLIMGFIGPV